MRWVDRDWQFTENITMRDYNKIPSHHNNYIHANYITIIHAE